MRSNLDSSALTLRDPQLPLSKQGRSYIIYRDLSIMSVLTATQSRKPEACGKALKHASFCGGSLSLDAALNSSFIIDVSKPLNITLIMP